MAVPILLYHHIAPPPPRGTPARSNYVTPQNFARQMGWLKRLGFTGLSLEQAMPYILEQFPKSGNRFSDKNCGKNKELKQRQGRVAAITFDDGFLSVFEAALPILAHYGFSSTCFFVADKIALDNDWDNPSARRAPLMGVEEIRQFMAQGHEVGSHSLTHPHLTKLDKHQAHHEILTSKQKLEGLIGERVTSFAYPYGDENMDLRQMVREAGYAQAVSTIKGRAGFEDDIFALPRHSIRRNDLSVHFLLKCLAR